MSSLTDSAYPDTVSDMTCSRGCCPNQATHYRSIVIGGVSSHAQSINTYEAGLDKDRPAYKRMRAEGLQPHALKGAARLEARASSRWEVESGRILPSSEAKRVDEAMTVAAQLEAT